LLAKSKKRQRAALEDEDFAFVKALQKSHLNFVVTDPHLPDNPVVYATQGFLDMTGYSIDQVVSRNIRFMLGPQTDPRAVSRIQEAMANGGHTSVTVLSYKVDGHAFWNQLTITPLAGTDGSTVNFVVGSLVLPRLTAGDPIP
jgi:PAS domain S-box-containing protein